MDTLIERKKRFTPRRIYGGAGVLFILVFVFYFIFRDTGSSMTIDKSRITIATVTENEFNDYVRVIGQVLPSRMIYLDAIEGGRVEERLHEEGAMVKKGDVILRLSNPLLNIGIMQSEADLAYQENELRNTRISMEQERLSLKQDRIGIQKEFIIKKRRYGQYKRLMEGQLIAREDYLQATEEYEAVKEQLSVLDERIRQDSLFRLTQISSLDENIMNMKRSLALVRERLENLKVKAPIDGQVGNLEAQIGQSISAGEHIGQIITADLKVQALIDEHYVERVVQELPADFTRDGENYKLEVGTGENGGIDIETPEGKEHYEPEECLQYGTLAVVFPSDDPKWTLVLNKDCVVEAGGSRIEEGGTVTLCKVAMEKTAPIIMH